MTNFLTKIGSIAKIFDGPHATPTRSNSGPFFLNIASLSAGRLDLNESDHVSETDFTQWTKRVTPTEGDLLFSYETRLGEAALMPKGIRACLGRRMGLLRFDRTKIDPKYFLYLYLSPSFQRLIDERTIQGATVNRIALSSMADWPVQVPRLEVQVAIGEILGVLDEKIAANRSITSAAESLMFAHFQSLSMDQPDAGQRTVPLTAYFDLNPKYPKPTGDEPVYLDMQKLPNQSMLISEFGTRPARAGVRFQNNDTLLARITPCLENRKTGYVDFLRNNETGIGSTEYIVMRSKIGVPASLSYFLAISPHFRQHAIRHMVGTSGRQRLSAFDLAKYQLSEVSEVQLNKWQEIASPTIQCISLARDESRNLRALRDILLPQLISGKLRVRDAEKQVEDVL